MMIWRGTAFICVVTVIAFCAGCSVSKGVNPDVLSASFSLNPASPAVGQSIQFTDTSTGSPTSWQWDFGDGASSTAQNPSHSYTSIGSKTVTLTVANASDSMSANRTLTVVTPVPNSFSFSPVQPKIGQSVQFTDTSTGSPTSWLWDFGDGATSTGRNPSHSYAVAGCYTITLTVSESSGSRSIKLPINIMSASAIIIDHHNTKLANMPPEWITAAKQNLHIAYGTASHGSQLTFGMTGLVGWKGSSYDWNFGGTGGALDLRVWLEDPFGYPDIATTAYYIGSPSITAWADATREYLAVHPEINVVIWSWCAHMATTDVAYVQAYIDLMDELESDFPNVKFVYMTGKTIGGAWGDGERWIHCHYLRATQIREHCLKNNRILYDFADIESWDPDGNWYGDKYVDCDCSYDSNGDGVLDRNWALDWQSDHPGEWYDCYAPHTQPLNANLKAYAAWHLWARLAGWDGN